MERWAGNRGSGRPLLFLRFIPALARQRLVRLWRGVRPRPSSPGGVWAGLWNPAQAPCAAPSPPGRVCGQCPARQGSPERGYSSPGRLCPWGLVLPSVS